MEAKYTSEEAIKFIEAYYKKVEEMEVEVEFIPEKTPVGIRCDEYDCKTTLQVTKEEEFLGIRTKLVDKLSEKNLKEIFNAILIDYNYEVETARFDDGLKSGGMIRNEILPEQAYCNGVILEVKAIAKQKKLGRTET